MFAMDKIRPSPGVIAVVSHADHPVRKKSNLFADTVAKICSLQDPNRNSRSLLTCVKWPVKLCSFIGLMPFDCLWRTTMTKTGVNMETVDIRRNYWRHLPALATLALFGFFSYWSVKAAAKISVLAQNYPNATDSGSWCPFMTATVVYLPIVSTLFGWFCLAVACVPFKELLTAMSEYRVREDDYKFIRNRVTKYSSLMTIGSMTFTVTSIVCIRHASESLGMSKSVASLFEIFPQWMTFWAIVTLGFCDELQKMLLETVTNAMERLNMDLANCLSSFQYISRKISVPGAHQHQQSVAAKSFVEDMDTIRVRYVSLCQTVNKISDCFESYLLVTLSSTILVLIGTSFLIMITMTEAKALGDNMFIIYNVFVFVWFWLRVVFICFTASRPGKAVLKAQSKLSLAEELLHPDECNNRLLFEVETSIIAQFQSHLRINKPIMDVKGFFEVSEGLILEVLANISNYVVIIIQFQPTGASGGYAQTSIMKALASNVNV